MEHYTLEWWDSCRHYPNLLRCCTASIKAKTLFSLWPFLESLPGALDSSLMPVLSGESRALWHRGGGDQILIHPWKAVSTTSPGMPEDQSEQISLRSQQGLSGEKNILGCMVTGHGGTGGHCLRVTALCSWQACHCLSTHPLQSCMGVDCGAPLAPKGSWSGPATALLLRSPPASLPGVALLIWRKEIPSLWQRRSALGVMEHDREQGYPARGPMWSHTAVPCPAPPIAFIHPMARGHAGWWKRTDDPPEKPVHGEDSRTTVWTSRQTRCSTKA